MEKKKAYWQRKYLLIMILITSVILSACGASDRSDGYSSGSSRSQYDTVTTELMESYDYSTALAPQMTANTAGVADGGAMMDDVKPMPMPEMEVINDNAPNDLINRKLIKNANLSVETEEFDDLIAGIEARVKQLGGYMEHFNVSNNSRYFGGADNNRYGSMTVRIPAVNYDFFVKEVSLLANVLNRNESVQDVTLQYVDLESQKKVSLTEHDRLLELLARAETIEDIIILEQRLSSVRYQIERMESQLRTYDNLIDYSTIYLSVSEVKELTPVTTQTTWEKISTGFSKSLVTIGDSFKDFLIGFIIAIPYIVVCALILLFWLVVIKIGVVIAKKRQRKRSEKGIAYQDATPRTNENIKNESNEDNQ